MTGDAMNYKMTVQISGSVAALLCSGCGKSLEEGLGCSVSLEDNHTLAVDRLLATYEEANGDPDNILCLKCLPAEEQKCCLN